MKQKPKRNKDLITLRGILLPIDWNQDGHVTALGLSGIDEKEYRIEAKAKKAELLALLQKEVELNGWYRERAGNRVIVLKDYRIL